MRQYQFYGYSVGAAYMPPVAAVPANQSNGQTARDAFMRPLQTCRKFAFYQSLLAFRLFVGRGLDPSLLFCCCRPFPRRGGVTPPYGTIKIHRAVGAGHCPALSFTATQKLQVNHPKGFPLRGKLSPQVTDEGATAGHFPLIRRVPRHLPPKGEGFGVTPPLL